jgi:hypothetical protein
MSNLPTKAPTCESTLPKHKKPGSVAPPAANGTAPKAPPLAPPHSETGHPTNGVKDKASGGMRYETASKITEVVDKLSSRRDSSY